MITARRDVTARCVSNDGSGVTFSTDVYDHEPALKIEPLKFTGSYLLLEDVDALIEQLKRLRDVLAGEEA